MTFTDFPLKHENSLTVGYKCIRNLKNSKTNIYLVHCNFNIRS